MAVLIEHTVPRLQLWVSLAVLSAIATAQGAASAETAAASRSAVVSATQKDELARLNATHAAVRARLPAEHRATLARLAHLVHKRIAQHRGPRDAFRDAKDSISELVPGLSERECAVVATYILDEIASFQETQMSFNLQYLQLQSQMQHENRSYTAISNIMKTKHDTVKNSISNMR